MPGFLAFAKDVYHRLPLPAAPKARLRAVFHALFLPLREPPPGLDALEFFVSLQRIPRDQPHEETLSRQLASLEWARSRLSKFVTVDLSAVSHSDGAVQAHSSDPRPAP